MTGATHDSLRSKIQHFRNKTKVLLRLYIRLPLWKIRLFIYKTVALSCSQVFWQIQLIQLKAQNLVLPLMKLGGAARKPRLDHATRSSQFIIHFYTYRRKTSSGQTKYLKHTSTHNTNHNFVLYDVTRRSPRSTWQQVTKTSLLIYWFITTRNFRSSCSVEKPNT